MQRFRLSVERPRTQLKTNSQVFCILGLFFMFEYDRMQSRVQDVQACTADAYSQDRTGGQIIEKNKDRRQKDTLLPSVPFHAAAGEGFRRGIQ